MNKLYSLLMRAQSKVENREEAQGVIEYTLVVGVISVALFIAFFTLGLTDGVTAVVNAIVAELP